MGRITENDSNNLCSISTDERGEVLCRYLRNKESLKDIGGSVFGRDDSFAGEQASLVTRAYGFHGRNGGKYPYVPEAAFYDFAAEFTPEDYYGGLDEGTFDHWWAKNKAYYMAPKPQPAPQRTPSQSTPPRSSGYSGPRYETAPLKTFSSPSKPAQQQPVRPSPAPSGNWDDHDDPPVRRKVTVADGGGLVEKLLPIGIAVVICLVLFGGGKSLFSGGSLFGGGLFNGGSALGSVKSFLSAAYNAEVFTYESKEYVGNQRFNKPEGACMRLDGGSDYTIGYFEGDSLEGYGVTARNDGANLQLGAFKKNQLNGYGILRCNGVDYVAEFKKGVANGYGYCFNNGAEQLVKFKKVSADSVNFAPTEVVAELGADGCWYKPNGKQLKVKDNTYKGITWLREGLIAIDGVEYYFDAEDREAYYDDPEIRLSWDVEGCEYDSVLSDEEGTYLLYLHGEELSGRHQYKEGSDLLINTFSVGIS